ncbi:DUF1304 domain-containing protein [Psychromonas sp.]|nr:DUF1304 domain-containing protein [Psychromonas sp.]
MTYLAFVFVALVALEHLYILILEMVFWTKPRALKVFGMSKEDAENSKIVAANLGLYNGFLGAGLIWGLVHPEPSIGVQVQIFFLLCVLVAALYGGVTAKKSILLVQGLPALVALLLVIL